MPHKAKQRLYFNAAKDALVPEGHEDAASLYANTGDEIPDSAAERFGLVDGDLEDFPATTEATDADAASSNGDADASASAGDDGKEASESLTAEGAAKEDAGADATKETGKSADKSAKPGANKAGK